MTEEGLSYQKAAADLNVDKMTLMRYMKKAKALICVNGYQSTILKNLIFFTRDGKTVFSHYALG